MWVCEFNSLSFKLNQALLTHLVTQNPGFRLRVDFDEHSGRTNQQHQQISYAQVCQEDVRWVPHVLCLEYYDRHLRYASTLISINCGKCVFFLSYSPWCFRWRPTAWWWCRTPSMWFGCKRESVAVHTECHSRTEASLCPRQLLLLSSSSCNLWQCSGQLLLRRRYARRMPLLLLRLPPHLHHGGRGRVGDAIGGHLHGTTTHLEVVELWWWLLIEFDAVVKLILMGCVGENVLRTIGTWQECSSAVRCALSCSLAHLVLEWFSINCKTQTLI